jgi:hypothetical protein
MKKSMIIFGTLVILLISCAQPDPAPNCGTIKFTWKANGTYFEGNSDFHSYSNPSHLHSYSFTACANGNSPTLSCRLHTPLQLGTYNLMNINDANSPFTGDGSYLDGTGSGYFGTDSSHTGTIILTTVAPDSAITGTFSFNALHSTSVDVINITEGTFTAIPQ